MEEINNILAKYFSGEATAEENKLVAEWKLQNKEEYTTLSEAWKNTDLDLLKGIEFKEFDHKTAWGKVDNRLIDHKETKIIKLNFYKKVAAACAIFLVGLSGLWFFNSGKNYTTIENTANATKEINLPDGSSVWLAANSTLDFAEDFKNDRSLKLHGEAFFEVAKDKSLPFIIETDFGDIEVLGTAFNIDANKKTTIVSVDHGKVELRNESGKIHLTAGQSANATENKISENKQADENYISWKTGEFYFNNTPLEDVVNLLNKHYSIKIELMRKPDPKDKVTATYNNMPIEEIIEMIEVTCDYKAEYSEDVIRLK